MKVVRIVGRGRAGGAFAVALARAGWTVDGPHGRGYPLIDAAVGVDLLLLCVSDAAVHEVATGVGPVADCVVAHVAGSFGLGVLGGHPRAGALHPLISLPSAEIGADRLADAAWFATAGDPLMNEVVADLGGRSFAVADADRALYHAAACIASNHLVALLGQVQRVAAAASAPFEAYLDLARGTIDNVSVLGPGRALTGPAARGDERTLDLHRAALSAFDANELAAYDAMVAEVRHLVARGGLSVQIVETIGEVRGILDTARRRGSAIGLVPTMGFLHEGHQSLMERAAADNDVVVATIFVNPLQFGVGEDLDSYPRDIHGDAKRATAAGVEVLFTPSLAEMYPQPVLTTVSVAEVAASMEGASRPTHFDGVATVVAKLFGIVGPCTAYFGEKDFQQLAVIRRMVFDLSMPVNVIGCPTVREHDGLAKSSRNVYLEPAERRVASVLYRALCVGRTMVVGGVTDADRVREAMRSVVSAEPLANLDYVEVADSVTLAPLATCDETCRLIGAVKFGRARLIDNIGTAADHNEPQFVEQHRVEPVRGRGGEHG